MSDITVERSASGVSVEPLRERVRGQVLTGEDAGYDEVRAVHNGMFSKWPLAVLRAEQVADVIAGVNFARDNGLELSIRNGGHSGPGFGTNDSGLVIGMTPTSTTQPTHSDWRQRAASSRPPASPALPSEAVSATWREDTDFPSTTFSPPMWSRRTESSSPPAHTKTRTCSGVCAAAAGISAW